jgi:hypothetical protein
MSMERQFIEDVLYLEGEACLVEASCDTTVTQKNDIFHHVVRVWLT